LAQAWSPHSVACGWLAWHRALPMFRTCDALSIENTLLDNLSSALETTVRAQEQKLREIQKDLQAAQDMRGTLSGERRSLEAELSTYMRQVDSDGGDVHTPGRTPASVEDDRVRNLEAEPRCREARVNSLASFLEANHVAQRQALERGKLSGERRSLEAEPVTYMRQVDSDGGDVHTPGRTPESVEDVRVRNLKEELRCQEAKVNSLASSLEENHIAHRQALDECRVLEEERSARKGTSQKKTHRSANRRHEANSVYLTQLIGNVRRLRDQTKDGTLEQLEFRVQEGEYRISLLTASIDEERQNTLKASQRAVRLQTEIKSMDGRLTVGR